MTRKSRRELEHTLAGLEGDTDPDTVRGWVHQEILSSCERGTEPEYIVLDADGTVIDEPDREGQVCIGETSAEFTSGFWIDEGRLPDWIDPDEDLPVIL